MKTKSIFISLLMSTPFALTAHATALNQSTTENQTTQQLKEQIKQLEYQQAQLEQNYLQLKQHINLTGRFEVNKNLRWVNVQNNQKLPKNTINANVMGGHTIAICQASYKDLGVHPGEFTSKGCRITYAGKSYFETQFSVLTGEGSISWKPSAKYQNYNVYNRDYDNTQNRMHPIRPLNSKPIAIESPVMGGFEKGHAITICRALHNNQINVGKVVSGNCNIGDDQKEIVMHDFQIMYISG